MALLFLLPLLPLSPAQSVSDPWWGPSDRARPTEGWAVRVPVSVENKLDYALQDPFVAAQLDLTKLLVDAGWTSQTIGAESRLRGFTLDVDSIRVVEYHRGFVNGPLNGPSTTPLPHVFYPALLEEEKYREFHPERNPSGTVVWQVQGQLLPSEKRDFYVYLNPLEFTDTPAPTFDRLDQAPLDALMWGTRGTTYLGFLPAQDRQGSSLTIGSFVPLGTTRVTVYTQGVTGFTPLASTSTLPNPFTLNGVASREITLPPNRAFKIEADRPVVVFAQGTGTIERDGFVPGRSGAFADDAFDVFGGPAIGFPNEMIPVRLVKAAQSGNANVRVDMPEGTPDTFHFLTVASPTATAQVPAGRWTSITGTGKFLVSMDAFAPGQNAPFPPQQVPALTGGPTGVEFLSFLHNDAAWFRVCPVANATVRVVDYDSGGNLQIHPEGSRTTTPAAAVAKERVCRETPVPRSIDQSHTFEFYSTPGLADGATGPLVPFSLFVGTSERKPNPSVNLTRPFIGAYGGLAGVDYDLFGETTLLGHYNHTRLTIVEEKLRNGEPVYVESTRRLQRDERFVLAPSDSTSTGRFHVNGTKPFAAFSLAPARYVTDNAQGAPTTTDIAYGRYVPGRPQFPTTTLGEAEFRGPLVELRSPETDARQIFRSTGPGSPLAFRLDVLNLGRWVGGESLPDTLTVTCSEVQGWTVEGCDKEFTLSSGAAERLSVVVTPSADDVNQTRTIEVQARSKAGGVAATFKLIVFVEVRYGVEMWFDVEGGRTSIDPPIGLDPGGTHRYNIVIKNTGSTTDTFTLTAVKARDDDGWENALTLDGEPVTSVRLDGGESRVLQMRATAPNAETAAQNFVTITAQSQTSALAADVVYTATRIRPKVDLDITLEPQTRLAEPNETVVFNLTTRNKGNDVFTVLFEQDSILPKGWNATLSVSEITLNPNPANDPALNFVTQLFVTPPLGARAGDLASVKIAAEIDTGGAGGRVPGDEVSAVVVVRRVYDLVTPPIFDAEAIPGQTLRFVLPVTNHGNGQVQLEILPGASDPAWPVRLEGDDPTLGMNDTVELPLLIDVPAGTPPGAYNLTFTTRLSREAIENLSIPVNVKVLSSGRFEGARETAITPGRPASLAYTVRNVGNVEGTFDLTAAGPAGWNLTFAPVRARLAPGQSVPVLLTINATRDAPDGSYAVELASQAEGQPATTAPLAVRIARPQLSLADLDASGALRVGELVLVSATIANAGGIQAENVSVALVVDGRVVDRVLLARIPVGSSALATLSWVSTQRGGDVRVVLDPEEEISMPSRDDTSATVTFGSRLGVPGPALGLLVAAFAAMAALRRKGRDDE